MDTWDPTESLRRLGGVADGSTLRLLGDPWRLRMAVRDGRVVHLGRNRYALPGVDDARAAAGRLHGVVSHLSAAQAWGWKVKRTPARPVVTVPRGRNVAAGRRAGVDVRWRDLPPGAVDGVVTTRALTVVDCARSLPFDEALSVADSALREGVVRPEELIAAATSSPRSGRPQALRVARAADSRADNPFESCLRAIALDVPGLDVQPQLVVRGIGRADLGDRRLHLLIEADSYEFHTEAAAFRHDIRRYTAMVRAGWTVVRFCWEDVMQHPDRVTSVLVDMVALAERSVHRCADCPARVSGGLLQRTGRCPRA